MPSQRIALRHRPASGRSRRPLLLAALRAAALLLVAMLGVAGRPTPALATSWVPDASGNGALLNDVACVSTSFCKAAGHDITANNAGAILSWNGTSWSTDVSGILGGVITGVACVSTSFCKVVGGSTIWSW